MMSRIHKALSRLGCHKCASRFGDDEGGSSSGGGTGSNNNNKAAKYKAPPEQKSKEQNPSPLTTRQAFSLRQSWKAIMRNEVDFGTEMFLLLFRTDPEIQPMFDSFKHITSEEDFHNNEEWENFVTDVMVTLDDVITRIDDYAFVKKHLARVGATHIKFAGFRQSKFVAVRDTFLESVRLTLGDRYTDNIQNIYTIFINFILESIVEGMEAALRSQ